MKRAIIGLTILLLALAVGTKAVHAEESCEGEIQCTTHQEEQCHDETTQVWERVAVCNLLQPTCRWVKDSRWTGHFEELHTKTNQVCETVDVEDCSCVTPEPTPEPTPAPQPSCDEQNAAGTWSGEHYCGWSPRPWEPGPYSPAVCSGIYADTPLLQGAKRVNDTTVQLAWWPVGNAGKYSLVYGYVGEPMIHGIASIDRSVPGLDITGLRANTKTQFELWAWRGECVSKSKVLISP